MHFELGITEQVESRYSYLVWNHSLFCAFQCC